MKMKQNVSLAAYSTMRLGGNASYLAEVDSAENLAELVQWAQGQKLPVIMIGRGSNIVWRDEGFNGLVLANKISGRDIVSEDQHGIVVKVGGGENWDSLVEWSVSKGLTGIEYMSLIPGTVGAAPVQNIGAYGGELSNTLIELEAYDLNTNTMVKLQNHDCNFSYRSSRFKTTDKGRFLITSITLNMRKSNPMPPFYETLQSYLSQHDIREYNPETIRQAVIAIRQSKLPDPEKVSNNGSFFTNPLIEQAKFTALKQTYPNIVGWPTSDGRVKLAAGWMVEQAGFKGVKDEQTGMATWPAQALVIVNESAQHTADLLAFKQKIVGKVQQMFGVVLEQEPELLP